MSTFSSSSRFSALRRGGFSLLEIIIVIGLLAAIAGIVLAGIGQADTGARRELARTFVSQSIRTPLQTFRLNMRRFPTAEEGLNALVKEPGNSGGNWSGPYIDEKDLLDPWGNPYRYDYPGKNSGPSTPDIWSIGPDGKEGTADDVNNWTK